MAKSKKSNLTFSHFPLQEKHLGSLQEELTVWKKKQGKGKFTNYDLGELLDYKGLNPDKAVRPVLDGSQALPENKAKAAAAKLIASYGYPKDFRFQWLQGKDEYRTDSELLLDKVTADNGKIMQALSFLREMGFSIEIFERRTFSNLAAKLYKNLLDGILKLGNAGETIENSVSFFLDNFTEEERTLYGLCIKILDLSENVKPEYKKIISDFDKDMLLEKKASTPEEEASQVAAREFTIIKVTLSDHVKEFSPEEFLEFSERIKKSAAFMFETFY